MPSYVHRGAHITFPQPLSLKDCRTYSFLMDADADALQALCDRCLNQPGEGPLTYRPLLGKVMLVFADIGRSCCLDPPASEIGWMEEIDVAFWIPVVGLKGSSIELLAWFLPYVFVNNGWAMATGRETYGFPKEIGTFVLPKTPQDDARFALDTLAVKVLGPNSQAEVQRLLEVRRTDDRPLGDLAEVWDDVRAAFKVFMETFIGQEGRVHWPGLGIIVEAFRFLVHHEVPMVFLKQFRAARQPGNACFQEIIQAPARLTEFRKMGRLPGEYKLTIEELGTHPVIKDLGLAGTEIDVTSAWFADFDFVMESASS
ncbi:MAG: acetoacetate decarboxylase family protein [Gemmataceae bacterium]|nr:acetoacetate decarboxylase family protein [Gemmataceae bacterium]MCI0740517.1 acetoacetate decarboxylase family protein [Gemmataceae bacterium]